MVYHCIQNSLFEEYYSCLIISFLINAMELKSTNNFSNWSFQCIIANNTFEENGIIFQIIEKLRKIKLDHNVLSGVPQCIVTIYCVIHPIQYSKRLEKYIICNVNSATKIFSLSHYYSHSSLSISPLLAVSTSFLLFLHSSPFPSSYIFSFSSLFSRTLYLHYKVFSNILHCILSEIQM